MSNPAAALLPRPLRLVRWGGASTFDVELPVTARAPGSLAEPALAHLERALDAAGLRVRRSDEPSRDVGIVLRLDEASGVGSQAYRLRTLERGAEVVADSGPGLFYGAATLAQWLALHADHRREGLIEAPAIEIEDRPSFAQRGVLLDISRNRVPTMATLRELVDLLSAWKINQLQLYIEHTFAYEGHEVVWREASPLTAEEARELDIYCRDRHIELVPNQQSFGHLHRWLVHEPYRRLAECPDGVEHPFSTEREPFSLCPTDTSSLELLDDLYGQLLPSFSSRLLNVGFDETFDLGRGRSAEACAKQSREEVYLGFLSAVHRLAAGYGRRIQFWADIVLGYPQLARRLPADGIALDWGYEEDHPFDRETAALAATGLEFYVCPGTSSWNSFAGRAANALANLANAAVAGREAGATGYLITDWGDNGHLQPLAASYLGLLAGAAFSWNAEQTEDWHASDWHSLLDVHAFSGLGLGPAAMSLADAYLATGASSKNGTALFHLVMSPADSLEHQRYRGLRAAGLESVVAAANDARAQVAGSRPGTDDRPRRELEWAANAIELGARVGLARLTAGPGATLASLPAATRRELGDRARRLSDRLEGLWLARSRPGGLEDSLRRLRLIVPHLG